MGPYSCLWTILVSWMMAAEAATVPLIDRSMNREPQESINRSSDNSSRNHSDHRPIELRDEPMFEQIVLPRVIIPNFLVCDPSKPNVCKSDLFEICREVNGVFRCLCPENISRNERGKCVVFNECFERSINNCSLNAECRDLEDGYTCRCKNGYRDESPDPSALPGRFCVETDEGSGVLAAAGTEPPPDSIEETPSTASDDGRSSTTPEEPRGRSDGPPRGPELPAAASAHLLAFDDGSYRTSTPTTVAIRTKTPSKSTSLIKADSSRDSFQTVDVFPTLSTATLSEPALREIFRSFDLDRSDSVSFWELKSAVELYRLRIDDEEIRKMIKVADASGEGSVDFGEFYAIMIAR